MSPGRPAVFLDRDGTVIVDRHYLGDPEGVEILPGAAEAIARLNRAGLPVILVTNQSGIGRGLFSSADLDAVQARLAEDLARAGAHLDSVYHCPHAPEAACECRKPAPGLFRRAAAEHGLDLARCYYIGDRWRDVAAGIELGGVGMLVGAETPAIDPEVPRRASVLRLNSLSEAVDRVLGEHSDD